MAHWSRGVLFYISHSTFHPHWTVEYTVQNRLYYSPEFRPEQKKYLRLRAMCHSYIFLCIINSGIFLEDLSPLGIIKFNLSRSYITIISAVLNSYQSENTRRFPFQSSRCFWSTFQVRSWERKALTKLQVVMQWAGQYVLTITLQQQNEFKQPKQLMVDLFLCIFIKLLM